ncbi:hypothetical protein SPRG_00680 [Saprolegnia parasitica CBS 223.65]|uniref:Protein HGH1 homolog n=1 Tax=Saprolegnia parasitica (strain CBS 223.65) TaxID=695850 RepID=A0A067D6J1_SAPPC|nr:hypothetical protein SPRG_00680 [Saprolegnia parasitica CBS 223.65]KDO34617.1 hypothetical protein SPRG_00680 [Saprolegnia parasitica CBS 223.65]|eukprot:XP_012194294.1 hypothetical protein SPRG_00680 [Saprolegnia parasitica CBS 223.65]
MASNEMAELVGFLSSPRADLRQSAMQLALGLTATDAGVHQLIKADAVKALCRLVSDVNTIARDAIHALVNITATHPVACESALQFDIVNRLMNQLDSDFAHKDLSMMLLANVTTTPDGAKALVANDAKYKVREVILQNLTMLFLESEPEPDGVDLASGEPKWDDDYQYIANVLANITQLEEGRDFLLQMRKTEASSTPQALVQVLLPQIHSPNVVRRRGIVQAVRNLCFDSDNHFFLYDSLDVVGHMQKRLVGPEPLELEEKNGLSALVLSSLGPKKKRESDDVVRQAVVECLLLLCSSRNGRNVLRQRKVYPIVRNAHIVEGNDEISDQIYKLVDFLIRDEEGEEPDWNEIRAKSLGVSNDDVATTSTPAAAPVFESVLDKPAPIKAAAAIHVEEDVDEDCAAALANEINLLDVSSDEEDDDVPPLAP